MLANKNTCYASETQAFDSRLPDRRLPVGHLLVVGVLVAAAEDAALSLTTKCDEALHLPETTKTHLINTVCQAAFH